MAIVMGGDWSNEHDFSHIWRDDEHTRQIVKNAGKDNKQNKNMDKKNLNGMSKRLADAIDVESAYKVYVEQQQKYNAKYNTRVTKPDEEVVNVTRIINGNDDATSWMQSNFPRTTKKAPTSTLSESDLLL